MPHHYGEPHKPKLTSRLVEAAESIVGVFSPRRAFQREVYKRAQRETRGARLSAYTAASKDRNLAGWISSGGSADADLLPELAIIRERSRELCRNDATAASIVQTLVDNTIGKGIRGQSRPDTRALGIEESAADEFRSAAERAFSRWVPQADVTGRLDLYGLQRLVLHQVIQNGEAFLVRNVTSQYNTPYSVMWDVVEADRVESPNFRDEFTTERHIRSGIEYDRRGRPIAYHIRRTHPGDGIYERRTKQRKRWLRLPASDPSGRPNVIHVYDPTRPWQTRGVPFLTPVMAMFDHLGRFQEAALLRERVAACFAAFVTTPDPDLAAAAAASGTTGSGSRLEELEPGIIEHLAPGQTIQFGNPTGLGNSYDPFVMRTLRQIGAALGLPYELVAKDFSRTNFSSARAAFLEARRVFVRLQNLIIAKVCVPSWKLVLEEAALRGELGVDYAADPDAWCRSQWVPPGWGWVDPTKEVQAAETAISAGLSSLADETAALGRDWEEILEQRAREQARKEELGLSTPVPDPTQQPPTEQDEDGTEDEDEDEETADE